jgi:hypothetical protein
LYKLAIVVPIYIDKNNYYTQLFYDEIASLDSDILKNIELIFVDDCSPVPVKINTKDNVNFKLLRVDDDIFWNVSGAKNLGSFVSNSEKILFIDLDHRVSEAGIKQLVELTLNSNQLVNFDRGDKIVPGIFCLNLAYYKKMGGLDEIFAGAYGYEDVHFQMRHKKYSGNTLILNGVLSYRGGEHHHTIKKVVKNKEKLRNLTHSGLFLNFKWHKVV